MNQIATRNMKDGSIAMLSETVGVKVREELSEFQTIITIYKKGGYYSNEMQKKYISGFWEMIIIDYSMPNKWDLGQFYIDAQYKISLGSEFLDWSFTRNNKGDIEHLVIISSLNPSENIIEGYDFYRDNKKNDEYIYHFHITRIDKAIFEKK